MTLLPFDYSLVTGRTLSDRARDEQAFYENNANAHSWKTALKMLAPIPLGFILYAGLLGLVLH